MWPFSPLTVLKMMEPGIQAWGKEALGTEGETKTGRRKALLKKQLILKPDSTVPKEPDAKYSNTTLICMLKPSLVCDDTGLEHWLFF